MTRSTDERKKRLAQLKREATKRGFDRHASVLKDVSDLPTELQSPAVAALATNHVIQNIIDFPPQIQHGWQYVPRQALLFTPMEGIHLLASIWPDREPQVTYIPSFICQLRCLYDFLYTLLGADFLAVLRVI
jgi:hypothetical protein